MPDLFVDFFSEKIITIQSNLMRDFVDKCQFSETTAYPPCHFDMFDPMNLDNVLKLV